MGGVLRKHKTSSLARLDKYIPAYDTHSWMCKRNLKYSNWGYVTLTGLVPWLKGITCSDTRGYCYWAGR